MSTIPDPATTDWVPLAGGADIVYRGAHIPATNYNEGEIVVASDGVAYMCVRPTNKTPSPWSTAGGLFVGYGTTLPSNPYNGQEYILVDSLTNPTWQWRFRYNANSTSTYKWEFIGGAPVTVNSPGGWSSAIGGTAWSLLSPSLPFYCPRPGDYHAESGAQLGGLVGDYSQLGLGRVGATPVSGVQQVACNVSTNYMGHLTIEGRINGVAAANDWVAPVYQSPNANAIFANRWLSVVPVRVS